MELKPPKKQTNNFSLRKLDCVSEEFLNKLLDSCQGYCQNGGYYAYKLLNIILWSAPVCFMDISLTVYRF